MTASRHLPAVVRWTLLLLFLLGVCFLSVAARPGRLSFVLLKKTAVFWFPRLLAGVVAGGTLAVAGVVLQGLLRNPLADPFTLGVSSGGALGSGVVSALGLASSILLPVGGIAGAFLAIFAVYFLAQTRGRMTITSLILAGVTVSMFCSSLLMLLVVINRRQLTEAVFQAMGHLNIVFTTRSVWIAAGAGLVILVGCVWILSHARQLDILSLSEETALSLGVDVQAAMKTMFLLNSVTIGLVSAFCGSISFVGLVVPHVCRVLFGPNHGRLVASSFVAGAGVLVLSDVLARNIGAGGVPLSVVTAFVGVPFFVYLLRVSI
ncbi:MAG: iron ABC transporter permease [candidate division WOR-3 bacterium]